MCILFKLIVTYYSQRVLCHTVCECNPSLTRSACQKINHDEIKTHKRTLYYYVLKMFAAFKDAFIHSYPRV